MKAKSSYGLTYAGTKAGVVSKQPLLLEHSFQVDPECSLVLPLLRLAPSSSSAGPPASFCFPFSVQGVLQRILNLLLPLLIGPVGRGCRPINAQSSEKGNDVAFLGKSGAIGDCKSETGKEIGTEQF